MHSDDVQAELDELCELWGIAKRDVPPNERTNDRDKRAKQLRELFSKRKAERVKAIEAAGHARVVAAAGRPGAGATDRHSPRFRSRTRTRQRHGHTSVARRETRAARTRAELAHSRDATRSRCYSCGA